MTSINLSGADDLRHLLERVAALADHAACFLVGGAVRDRMTGRPISDIDLTYDGDAPAFARAIADGLSAHYALLDDQRATARVILDDAPVRTVDVTRLRGDIETDLAARDFTIDAMAAPLAPIARGDVEVIDPHDGEQDLAARTIRLVSQQALIDDPLRLLRAVRLAVELDFAIESDTAEAIRRRCSLIEQPAAERVRDEIVRAFDTPRAATSVRLLDSLGLLDVLLPEVSSGRGVTQPKEHAYDVLEHNIQTVAALDWMLSVNAADTQRSDFHRVLWEGFASAPHLRDYLSVEMSEGRSRATLLKLTGLLHDVAKPQTRAPDETGRIRFFGHGDVGADMACGILQRLRFSRRETEFVATIINAHLRPGQLGQNGAPTRRAMFRFFRDTGDAADAVLILSLADALAARGPRMTIEDWGQGVAYIAYLLSRRYEDGAIVHPARIITGDDIMRELAIGPGHEVGRLLAAVEEAQAAGEVSSRKEALDFVRKFDAAEGSRVERRGSTATLTVHDPHRAHAGASR
jgi:poly(A) polymerase